MSGKLRARILKGEVLHKPHSKISYTPNTSGLYDFYEEFNRRLARTEFYKGQLESETSEEWGEIIWLT